MSRVRAKDTRPELSLRRALWAAGVRGLALSLPWRNRNSGPLLEGPQGRGLRRLGVVARPSLEIHARPTPRAVGSQDPRHYATGRRREPGAFRRRLDHRSDLGLRAQTGHIRSRKTRPSGSPGNGDGDTALSDHLVSHPRERSQRMCLPRRLPCRSGLCFLAASRRFLRTLSRKFVPGRRQLATASGGTPSPRAYGSARSGRLGSPL